MAIEVWYDDDDTEKMSLPTKMEVCPRCKGRGTHMNPNIDGHGISASDECWDDDDFREMYFGGGYDVVCEKCNGRNVVEVPDEDRMTPEQCEAWSKHLAEEAEYESIRRAEMAAELWFEERGNY